MGLNRRTWLQQTGLGLGLAATGWAQTPRATVWLVLSDPGGAYAEAAEAWRVEWGRWEQAPQVVVYRDPSRLDKVVPPPQMVVTLGVVAYKAVANWIQGDTSWAKVPVVAGLLPRAAYTPIPNRAAALSSAVFLDQPVGRFLRLIDQALPGRQRVGVLWGPTSRWARPELQKVALGLGKPLVEAQLPAGAQTEDIYNALRGVLSEVDVLLGLPDPVVFNALTLQNMLIATYRQRVPFFTYAASHVTAGATAALYVTPRQVGARLAVVAKSGLTGSPLPDSGASPDFEVALNAQVGRSLGLSLPTSEELVQALRIAEVPK